MKGLAIDGVAVGDLDDPPEIHHRHAVGNVLYHGQVVGNKQQGQVELGLELGEEVEDLGLDGHVESRHRLIGHNQTGPQDQSPGNSDSLALTTRELMRITSCMGGLETDQLQHLGNPNMTFILRRHSMDPQALGDRLTDRAPRIEGAVGILEDHLHLAPNPEKVLSVEVSDIGAVEIDRSRGRLQQPHQHPTKRGLTTPRFTDKAQSLTSIDVEVDIRNCPNPALGSLKNAAANGEIFGESFDLDEFVFHDL
jgi:hypothetical protein